jgi:hypothetical protein
VFSSIRSPELWDHLCEPLHLVGNELADFGYRYRLCPQRFGPGPVSQSTLHEMNTGAYTTPDRMMVPQFLERFLSDYSKPRTAAKTYDTTGSGRRRP